MVVLWVNTGCFAHSYVLCYELCAITTVTIILSSITVIVSRGIKALGIHVSTIGQQVTMYCQTIGRVIDITHNFIYKGYQLIVTYRQKNNLMNNM